MRFFRRASKQGLTAYLRLPGRIAYARVDRRGPVPKLLAAGVVPVEGDKWGEALAQLHGRGPVSLVLNPADYRLRLLDSPNVPPEELRSAVRWQIQDMLDFHADDGTVDVLEVPHPEHVSHMKQIFAVAAKNSQRLRSHLSGPLLWRTMPAPCRRRRSVRSRYASYPATRAVTAAKESWKPALKRLSGVTTRITSAASATLRIANAGRSAIIARNMMKIIMKDRMVAWAPPEIRR